MFLGVLTKGLVHISPNYHSDHVSHCYATPMSVSSYLSEVQLLRRNLETEDPGSLFQALGQWGRSKTRAGDKWDQRQVGFGREKERAWPFPFPYQTPLVAGPLFQSSALTESLEQAMIQGELWTSLSIPASVGNSVSNWALIHLRHVIPTWTTGHWG